jgi:hypothetical protein
MILVSFTRTKRRGGGKGLVPKIKGMPKIAEDVFRSGRLFLRPLGS